MWLSTYGVKPSPFKFPYEADDPSTGKRRTFHSTNDVMDVIERINEQPRSVSRGQNLYYLTPLFSDQSLLLSPKAQDYIRQYNLSKNFNLPIASSLGDASAELLDAFEIIENEINNCRKKDGN